jgi:hypothetical protein
MDVLDIETMLSSTLFDHLACAKFSSEESGERGKRDEKAFTHHHAKKRIFQSYF